MSYVTTVIIKVLLRTLYLENLGVKWRMMIWSRSVMIGFLGYWELELFLWSFPYKVALNVIKVLFNLCKVFVNLLNVFRSFKNLKPKLICSISIRRLLLIIFLILLQLLLIWVNHIFVRALIVIVGIHWSFFMLNCSWKRWLMRPWNSWYSCDSWFIMNRDINSAILFWLCWIEFIRDYSWTWMIKIWRLVVVLRNF